MCCFFGTAAHSSRRIEVDMWKIELRPDLILGLWIEVVSQAAELMRKNIWDQEVFPTAARGQVFSKLRNSHKAATTQQYKKGPLLALLTLCRKYLLQGPRTCIFCPGTLFYEQYDKPQLSLASKYGNGHSLSTSASLAFV